MILFVSNKKDCVFEGNVAFTGNGAALLLQHNSNNKIENSRFSSNDALQGEGGAIFYLLNSDVSVNYQVL